MTLVVNLFAGPGAGKSTLAAGLFYRLKSSGKFTVEMPTEFAKDLTWEGGYNILAKFQPYLFGVQYFRIARLLGQVDCIVCDSPLPLAMCYGPPQPPSWQPFVMDIFNSMNNLNYFVVRTKPYEQTGRSQNEDEARQIDFKISKLLSDNRIRHSHVLGSTQGCDYLYTKVHDELDHRKFYREALNPSTRNI